MPKILSWDIETSYNQVNTFGMRKVYINPSNIEIERHLFCASYKWHGKKKIHSVSILDDPKRFAKDIHDDYHVVKHMHNVISQADAIVAHYGDGFDYPVWMSRVIFHKLPPMPPIISIDTVKIAKKVAGFNSNKLDYLTRLLCRDSKMVNPTNLWDKCFKGDEKALKRMVKYNKKDVKILEEVFDILMPYVKNNPLNRNLFKERGCCPNCGSVNLIKRGYNTTRVNKYQRYQCGVCGAWSSDRNASKDYKVTVK